MYNAFQKSWAPMQIVLSHLYQQWVCFWQQNSENWTLEHMQTKKKARKSIKNSFFLNVVYFANWLEEHRFGPGFLLYSSSLFRYQNTSFNLKELLVILGFLEERCLEMVKTTFYRINVTATTQ